MLPCVSHMWIILKRTRLLHCKKEPCSLPAIISLERSLSQTSNNMKNSSTPISRMTIQRRVRCLSGYHACYLSSYSQHSHEKPGGMPTTPPKWWSPLWETKSQEKTIKWRVRKEDTQLWLLTSTRPGIDVCIYTHIYIQHTQTRVIVNVQEYHPTNAL